MLKIKTCSKHSKEFENDDENYTTTTKILVNEENNSEQIKTKNK